MNNSASRHPAAIILAAGKGTRMNSDLPKVLHPVAEKPMVCWVVEACRQVGADPCIIVVGHQAEKVREALADHAVCRFVEQREQLGTGHAVMQAEPEAAMLPGETDVLVLCGDGPLIRADTLRKLLEVHRNRDADATLATAEVDDPSGYGRIVRGPDGRFQGIVEEKDATDAQRGIREINPSYYCFKSKALFEMLGQVENDNAKGEYYITDVFSLLLDQGRTVEVITAVPPEDVLSINTPAQLSEVDAILTARLGASAEDQR